MTESSSNAAPLDMGAMVADKYRIDGVLGHGGMGVVYSAKHTVSGKSVAVKWMLPAEDGTEGPTERFIQEARATARIEHPNVVDIYDVGVQDGSAYLVMEHLRGESLAERLEKGRMAPGDAVATLMPALRGVAAAHAQGVIHRDLKPDNIFLCEGPTGEWREPKVLDFGISKIAAGDDGRDLALTQAGMVMGTPHYMSPEQVRGTRDVDIRSDIYAFGVILYEMLTDTHPFDADTYNDLIVKIVTAEPVPVHQLNDAVDERLAQVIMRAMAREADMRFQSVEALAAALEPFSSGARFATPPGVPSIANQPVIAEPTPKGDASLQPQQTVVDPREVGKGGHTGWLLLAAGLLFAGVVSWLIFPDESPREPATAGQPPAAPPVPVPASAIAPAPAPEAVLDEPEVPRGVSEERRAGQPEVSVEGAGSAKAMKPANRATRAKKGTARADRKRRAVTRRAGAAGASPRARELADDWDEQLPTQLPVTPIGMPPTPAGSAAGELDVDDL